MSLTALEILTPPIPFEKRTSVRIPMLSAIVDAGFPSRENDVGSERAIEYVTLFQG